MPPTVFRIGMDSPVMEAWFTIASPAESFPSSGIIFPVRTTISDPVFTSLIGRRSSCPFTTTQTLSTFKDMVRARSSTDFLCVHSSSVSPIESRNMTEEAVPKSPRSIELVIATASRSGTSIFPRRRQPMPRRRKGTDLMSESAILRGAG